MKVTDRYPAQRKRRRFLWTTRRLLWIEVHHLTKDRTRIAGLRRRVQRLNVGPGSLAHTAALKGAHLAMIEAEQNPSSRQRWAA